MQNRFYAIFNFAFIPTHRSDMVNGKPATVELACKLFKPPANNKVSVITTNKMPQMIFTRNVGSSEPLLLMLAQTCVAERRYDELVCASLHGKWFS